MAHDCTEEKRGEVQASEILAKIQHGEPVIYDCVIVKGDLGRPPRSSLTIISSITITNSIIRGIVNFEDAIFFNRVDFRGTTFAGETSFKGSSFRQPSEFEGAHFQEATYFSDPIVDKHAYFIEAANFKKTVFEKYVDFSRVQFDRGAEFSTQNREESFNNRSIFKGDTYFNGANFIGLAHFEACEFQKVEFRGARFEKEAYFQNATFKGYTNFLETNFKEYTDFNNATFSSLAAGVGFAEAEFYGYFTDFRNVIFNGIHANFRAAQFTGEFVSFRNAKFRNISDQETACRKAKNIFVKAGDRDEEEYHFYREMEAKRIQKGIRGNSGLGLGYLLLRTDTWSFWEFFFYDVLEFFFVQKIFGYGVHPYWLFGWWFTIVVAFAVIYGIKGGIEEPEAKQWFDFLWFSIATAATPGYALYKPVNLFKFIAGIEAILGTFMWAAFITTFARKFSR